MISVKKDNLQHFSKQFIIDIMYGIIFQGVLWVLYFLCLLVGSCPNMDSMVDGLQYFTVLVSRSRNNSLCIVLQRIHSK